MLATELRSRLPVRDIAVHHFVGLALLPELASCLDRGLATVFTQIGICHDFTAHEFILKVRAMGKIQFQKKTLENNDGCLLNNTGCLRRFSAFTNRPGPNFVGTTSKVTNELTIMMSKHVARDKEETRPGSRQVLRILPE